MTIARKRPTRITPQCDPHIPHLDVHPLIFISYSRTNSSQLNALLRSLAQAVFDHRHILCDVTGLPAAVPYKPRIAQWLKDCDIFIALYSPNFFFSKNCWHELVTALRYSQPGPIKLFVPIILNKSLASFTPLAAFQFYSNSDNIAVLLTHSASQLTTDYKRIHLDVAGCRPVYEGREVGRCPEIGADHAGAARVRHLGRDLARDAARVSRKSADQCTECVDYPNFRRVNGLLVEPLIGKAGRVAAQLRLNPIVCWHRRISSQEAAEAVTITSSPRQVKTCSKPSEAHSM